MKTLLAKPRAVGFTGTWRGMTGRQADGVQACLAFAFLPGAEFHHGDCVGADDEAAGLAKSLGYVVVAHPGFGMGPGEGPTKRAYSKHNDRTLRPQTYMRRNQDVVDVSDELYAAPSSAVEQMRSGTWSTIRRAREKGIYVGIVGPNGEAL
jgi:hypothetical protein